jgi:hypothetical protein
MQFIVKQIIAIASLQTFAVAVKGAHEEHTTQ